MGEHQGASVIGGMMESQIWSGLGGNWPNWREGGGDFAGGSGVPIICAGVMVVGTYRICLKLVLAMRSNEINGGAAV